MKTFFTITSLLFFFSANMFAQTDNYQTRLEKIRNLPLDSAHNGIMVHFPEGGAERAGELGPVLNEALQFFSDSLSVDIDFRLALLKEKHWKELTNSSYAIPHVGFGTFISGKFQSVGNFEILRCNKSEVNDLNI